MSRNNCPNCGKKFKLSLKDKAMRKAVQLNARILPVFKDVCEEAEKFCNECWTERVKPVAMSLAGVQPKNDK